MAIKSIPSISGPSFGGVIYGLKLVSNYSSSPSKLVLNIVNERGNYTEPTLSFNSSVRISLGNFSFNGFPTSYNIKESANERILDVELSDFSYVLDRHYISLWKPGLFEDYGSKLPPEKSIKKFEFEDSPVLVPVLTVRNDGIRRIEFQEKTLNPVFIQRTIYQAGQEGFGKIGNMIYLGQEMFRDSECDLSSTYYNFNQFRRAIENIPGLQNINMNIPIQYKATYEGSLRQVLQSWCSDFGYDFYWDYSKNEVVIYDVSVGIIPSIDVPSRNNRKEIIEYDRNVSIEGTFIQYGAAYTAFPKQNVKTLPGSYSYNIISTINPYSLSYFLRNVGTRPTIKLRPDNENDDDDEESTIYGGSRAERDFLAAAFLGYVNQNLRNIYCMMKEHWGAMGMKKIKSLNNSKSSLVESLKKLYPEQIKRLEEIDETGLPNINFAAVAFDEGELTRWQNLEQNAFSIIGRFYRHMGNSETFFYCSKTSITEVQCIVDPESQNYEGDNIEFQGLKLFERQGQMSRTSENMASSLEITSPENTSLIEDCLNVHFEITEDLRKKIGVTNTNNNRDGRPSIVIAYPSEDFIKDKFNNFEVIVSRGSNDLEKSVIDILDAQRKQKKNNCPDYEETLKKLSCVSAQEEAKNIAIKRFSSISQQNDSEPVAGLVDNNAQSAQIKIFKKSERLHAPSDRPYVAVYKYQINIEKISDDQLQTRRIYFNDGSASYSVQSNILGIDFILDNATDVEFDSYAQKRQGNIPTPATFSNINPQEKYRIVVAGDASDFNLSPANGLSSLDVSYSSNGFITTLEYSSRPPQRNQRKKVLREIESQLNRASFNST